MVRLIIYLFEPLISNQILTETTRKPSFFIFLFDILVYRNDIGEKENGKSVKLHRIF